MSQLGAILCAKVRMTSHAIASVRSESRLKVGVVGIASILLWFGLFLAFLRGFMWLQNFEPNTIEGVISLGDLLMARLLSVFALSLFVLLIFSNVLIAFSTMYKAREVQYLLISPLSVRVFFLARLVECIVFSSWASAFLGSPLILAYGIVTVAPAGYYAATAAFYVPFVTIPAALGAIVTLVLVRVFPRVPRATLFLVAGVAVVLLYRSLTHTFSADRLSEGSLVSIVLEAATQTQSPFLPSYWAAHGVISAATGQYATAAFQFLLLLSNALMATLLASELAQWLFLPGYSALLGSDRNIPRPLGRGILGRLDAALGFIKEPARTLIVKDIKLFWRDPTQWTQFAIFFGIMAVYIANLGNNQIAAEREVYRSFVAGLNIAACSLILASLTSRFVYPLISLEGIRFWILGLAPLSMKQLMRQKFWLSVAMTSPFTITLVVLSSILLEVGPLRFWVALYSICLANLSLAGLAVGLGSLYPNFQEDNPARIVSGMGGTLNFLLSVGYIALLVGSQIFIFQWDAFDFFETPSDLWRTLAILLVFNTVLSAAATIVPMKLGHMNLMKTEF